MDTMSNEAHESVSGAKVAMYIQLLQQLETSDYICDELEELLNMRHQTASARMAELRKLGYIKRTGNTRSTRSGRNAHICALTPAGRVWITTLSSTAQTD